MLNGTEEEIVSQDPVPFGGWKPIESAPKDGTRILAFGMADDDYQRIFIDTNKPKVPVMEVIHWIEGWYDDEIDNGDGTYRKEKKLGYSYWKPHGPYYYKPTHWMPLPPAPKEGA